MFCKIGKSVNSMNLSFSRIDVSQLLLSLFRKAFSDHASQSCCFTIISACLIFFKELNTDVFLCMFIAFLT